MKYVSLFLMAAAAQMLAASPLSEKESAFIDLDRTTSHRSPTAVSKSLIRQAAPVSEGCTLTIKDTRDGGQLDESVQLFAFNLDQNETVPGKWDKTSKTAELLLVPGHYDLAIPFRKGDLKTWVFRENVEIMSDMTLEVGAGEATSVVRFNPVDPKGTRLEGPVYDYYETFDILDGPCKAGTAYIFIVHEKYSEFCTHIAELGIMDFGPTDGKFYTMDDQRIAISPNSHFALHGVFITHNTDGQYIVSLGSKGCGNQTLTNDLSNFLKIDVPFVASPAGEIDPNRAHEFFTTVYGTTTGVTGGCTLSAYGVKNDTYLLSVDHDNDAHANLALIPTVDEFVEQAMWSETAYALRSSPLMAVDGKLIHPATGCRTGGFTDSFTCNPDGEYSDLSITHPHWSFEHPAEGYTVGGSCPTLQLQPMLSKDVSSGSVSFSYLGRFDEVHEFDVLKADIRITKGEAEQYSGDYAGYKNFWRTATAGVHTLTIENTNIKVDGLDGRNLSIFTFDPRADDPTAPSVSALRFHDKDGRITDHFAKADDGIMSLAVADYTHGQAGRNFLTTSAPASVKIEYAPYGSDDFAELKATTDGDVFRHGYGQLFTASLAGVTKGSANGWYDLRVTLTDKAGNTGTQLISPAFKADAPAGVRDIRGDESGIAFDGASITADGAIEVYSVAGARIAASADGSLDTTALAGGVYIVRADGKARKIIVK